MMNNAAKSFNILAVQFKFSNKILYFQIYIEQNFTF